MKAHRQPESAFKPVPVGAHIGVCTALYALGRQPSNNPQYEAKQKVAITWTLPSVLNDAGFPMTITGQYTASMDKKANLRKLIESWFGKAFPDDKIAREFDMKALLGRACTTNVIHRDSGGKTYANVAGVFPLTAGVPVPAKPEASALQYYSPDDQGEQELKAAYASMPDWLRTKVDNQLPEPADGPEIGEETSTAEADADIPF